MATKRAATEAEAKALASATRLRIIRLCLDRALTNKEIAHRLGANPATTLHHVRTLVSTGFLAPQEDRRGTRGAREVPYCSTGKSWTLSVHEAGVAGSGAAMVQAFLEEIALVDLDNSDVADLGRLGLRLTGTQFRELQDRLGALLNEYADKPLEPNGRPYSIFLALYADVSRE